MRLRLRVVREALVLRTMYYVPLCTMYYALCTMYPFVHVYCALTTALRLRIVEEPLVLLHSLLELRQSHLLVEARQRLVRDLLLLCV
jgi:hypothetical protein